MKREETLPESWKVKSLGETTELLKDGTHGTHKNVSAGIPLLSAKDIFNGKITLDNSPRLISEEEYTKIHQSYRILPNDVLLTVVGTLGRVAIVPNGTTQKFTFQRSVAIIRPKSDIMSSFLAVYFNSPQFQNEMVRRSNASAQAGVYLGELAKIPVIIPPLEQQQKIAAILSSLDDAIEKTGAVIHQLEVVKRGLMQELFTRGVPGWHEKFVEIKRLGQVPESWSVYTLGDFAVSRQGYTFKPKYQGQKQGKWMYSKVSDMEKAGNELYILRTANYIDDDVLEEIKAKPFEAETTIFPRVGAALRTNKKRLLKVPSLVDDNIMTLVVIDKEKCLPKYLYRWMESINLEMFCNDGPLPSINSKNLLRTQIALPSLEEQKQIVHTFYVIDERIKAEQTKKGQLETIKKGLMQGLLSGRVGVKGG